MSAFGGKADIIQGKADIKKCPLMTQSGQSLIRLRIDDYMRECVELFDAAGPLTHCAGNSARSLRSGCTPSMSPKRPRSPARLIKRVVDIASRIAHVIFMRRYRRKQIMPDMVLCPKCHGQRTSVCLACNGTGQRRCDVCGGSGEVEPPPPTAPVPSSAVNEHQPSCFGLEEERGERWKGSGATGPAINEVKSSL